MAKKTKTLSYRQACFLLDKQNKTLEELTRSALTVCATTESRTIEYLGYRYMGNHVAAEDNGIYLHVTMSQPGSSAPTTPDPDQTTSADIEEQPPPTGKQFKDGDIFALIIGNGLFFTNTSMRENKLATYLIRLFKQAKLKWRDADFEFRKVPALDKIALLQSEGVKSLEFNGCMHYAETLPEVFGIKDSVLKNTFIGISSAIKSTYESDEDSFEKIVHAENLSVKVALELKGKDGAVTLTTEEFSEIAKDMLNEEDDFDTEGGFKIITGKGNSVTADNLTVARKISFEEFAKSIHYDDAWQALYVFSSELIDNGTVTL